MRLQPTVRLYAPDQVWCSLDPDSAEDRERFSDLIHEGSSRFSRTTVGIRFPAGQPASTLRAALVFPQVAQRSSAGVPPSGAGAQQPDVPTADSFAGEAIDFVLFPEGYVSASDQERAGSLTKLAEELGAPLLVGALDRTVDSTGRAWQVLLRFDPDGSRSRVYVKHSTADAVAFERPDWEPTSVLPTFELGGVGAGATICHDHYLGLLPRALARRNARLWVNPSFDNVTDIKWSSILRLRAVENRFFSLCTLHCDVNRQQDPPLRVLSRRHRALGPASRVRHRATPVRMFRGRKHLRNRPRYGQGRRAARLVQDPVRQQTQAPQEGEAPKAHFCCLERRTPGRPRMWGPGKHRCRLPGGDRPRFGLRGSGAERADSGCGRVFSGARSRQADEVCPDHLESLGAASSRCSAPATLTMGRAIECCAPIVISDRDGIHELVELSNRNKIPARRVMESSGEAIVDLGYAWGLDNAFKMVTKHLAAGMARRALNRYRSLGTLGGDRSRPARRP